MVVTGCREGEHHAIVWVASLSCLLYGSYRRSLSMSLLAIIARKSLVVMPVTAKRDAGDAAYPIIAACCSHIFPSFASALANHLHSDFAAVFAAVRQCTPLQEPFGDPRPQTFFFPRSASSAR